MVEILVTLTIGAAVMIVGVMVFQSLGTGRQSIGSTVSLDLDADVSLGLFGSEVGTIDVWVAPNFGRRLSADQLRDTFYNDLARASAVFCLGRGEGVSNPIRPTVIPVNADFDGRAVDLPDTFRLLLEAVYADATGIFDAYRGASLAENATIFMLQPSAELDELSVLAIYEIDIVPFAEPAGNYAAVRRFSGDVMTDFYDIFYEGESGLNFSPLVVSFERAARLGLSEGTAVDRLKVAAERPFYLVWWPDPAMPNLMPHEGASPAASLPRASYPNMGGQTGLFFVVPMFPAL